MDKTVKMLEVSYKYQRMYETSQEIMDMINFIRGNRSIYQVVKSLPQELQSLIKIGKKTKISHKLRGRKLSLVVVDEAVMKK